MMAGSGEHLPKLGVKSADAPAPERTYEFRTHYANAKRPAFRPLCPLFLRQGRKDNSLMFGRNKSARPVQRPQSLKQFRLDPQLIFSVLQVLSRILQFRLRVLQIFLRFLKVPFTFGQKVRPKTGKFGFPVQNAGTACVAFLSPYTLMH
jgi:hypothetical protein